MIKPLVSALLLIFLVVPVAPLFAADEDLRPSASAAVESGSGQLLFIGNSFTFYNELPQVLQVFFFTRNMPLKNVRQHTPGGTAFSDHWSDESLRQKLIPSAPWTHWILQDNSFNPVESPESTVSFGGRFCRFAKENKAMPVLFLTWAYADASGKPNLAMQETLTGTYSPLAIEADALLAPCGPAWVESYRRNPKLNLYSEDGRHPGPAGTYLAACVFYATLTGKSPLGLPAQAYRIDLSPEDARFLQEVAWTTVKDFAAQPMFKGVEIGRTRFVEAEQSPGAIAPAPVGSPHGPSEAEIRENARRAAEAAQMRRQAELLEVDREVHRHVRESALADARAGLISRSEAARRMRTASPVREAILVEFKADKINHATAMARLANDDKINYPKAGGSPVAKRVTGDSTSR